MKDLSLHVLDLVENSFRAGAGFVRIEVVESGSGNKLSLLVEDDGRGMSEEMAAKVMDPFVTSRTERSVGLGLPLLAETVRQAGGELRLETAPGSGTKVEVDMELDHIDRKPVGDLAASLSALLLMGGAADWEFTYSIETAGAPAENFSVDTRELKAALDGGPLDRPEVVNWVERYIFEGLDEIGAARS